MKQSENKSQLELLWLSYANIIALLLFLFLFISAAVATRYFFISKQEQASTKSALNTKEKDNKILKLLSLNQDLKNNLTDLQNKNQELKKQNDELRSKVDLLLQNNSVISSQNQDINATIQDLKNENLNLTAKIESLNLELKNKQPIPQKEPPIQKDDIATKNNPVEISKIKSEISQQIRKSLKEQRGINSKDTTLIIDTSVFFEKGKAELKKDSKKQLRNILKTYFEIVFNKNTAQILEAIDIQGFTDSGGEHEKNIKLTKQRAQEVLKLAILSAKDKRLKQIATAQGRGSNEPVIKNSIEDKEASRRVEIRLKISQKPNKI